MDLQPLAKVTGLGAAPRPRRPRRWAAWRWAGRAVSLPPHRLAAAGGDRRSPTGARRPAHPGRPTTGGRPGRGGLRPGPEPSVCGWPPAADRFPLVLAAAGGATRWCSCRRWTRPGTSGCACAGPGVPVAVMPDEWAQARGGCTVVGRPERGLGAGGRPGRGAGPRRARRGATSRSRRPAWHARDVVVERARRAGCALRPGLAVPDARGAGLRGRCCAPSRSVEREGWPIVDVIDRRHDEPGPDRPLLRAAGRRSLRGEGTVVCVLNRKGRARLLACAACGEMARCERCGSALVAARAGDADLRALRPARRPTVCAACGGTRLKLLRVGVTRAAEELEALARTPVVEVTGELAAPRCPRPGSTSAPRPCSTRSPRADVVAFLDLDQELLAPRYRAAEQALGLLARAARLLGGRRRRDGRLVLQTRLPDHEVVQAALHADPARVSDAERRAAPGPRLPAGHGHGRGQRARWPTSTSLGLRGRRPRPPRSPRRHLAPAGPRPRHPARRPRRRPPTPRPPAGRRRPPPRADAQSVVSAHTPVFSTTQRLYPERERMGSG